VTNIGTLEATGSGGLIVNSDVANSGLIWAHGGNITINGVVTGSGSAMIDGTATLEFGAASSVDITFAANAAGMLTLKDAADFTGTISGFSSDDQIDLTNISYSIASVSNASYSSSTNITTLAITDVFTVLGHAELAHDPNFQELRELTARMLRYYREQDWTQALATIELCRKAAERFGIGALYDTYAERIDAFRRHPPPPDWNGVYEAESK